MKTRFALSTLASALAVAALLTACGGQSTSAADTSQLQSEITTLQSQVAQLQTQVAALGAAPAVFIKAPNAPAVKMATQMRTSSQRATTTAPSCTGLGTLTGRPANSDPIASNLISGVSCAGYYYTVSGAATSADTAIVQPLASQITVWYDAPNCTGNAYVSLNSGNQSVSAGAVANGAVFRVFLNGQDDPTNPATYWMLKPGTAVSDPSVMSSNTGGQCSSASGSWDMYQLAPNDQTVSGVPSAPIRGPVTIG